MTNKAANLLETIVWQNSNMGAKKSKQTRKPEPFVPDFMKTAKEKSGINKEAEMHTTDEVANILSLPRG